MEFPPPVALLRGGAKRLCRHDRAILPEEPEYMAERDADLRGVRLPWVEAHLRVRRKIDALDRDDGWMGRHGIRQHEDWLLTAAHKITAYRVDEIGAITAVHVGQEHDNLVHGNIASAF